MFILVRSDLSKSQQGVQGGHALAQFMLSYPDLAEEWNNQTIVYLKTDHETIQRYEVILPLGDVNTTSFREPDIGNQLTALAAYGYDAEKYFTDFRLM